MFWIDGVDTRVRVEYAISWVEEMEKKMKDAKDVLEPRAVVDCPGYVRAQLNHNSVYGWAELLGISVLHKHFPLPSIHESRSAPFVLVFIDSL